MEQRRHLEEPVLLGSVTTEPAQVTQMAEVLVVSESAIKKLLARLYEPTEGRRTESPGPDLRPGTRNVRPSLGACPGCPPRIEVCARSEPGIANSREPELRRSAPLVSAENGAGQPWAPS